MYQIDFSTPVHVYFIGIGGISMSGLAEILLEKHFKVSGSDARQSALTDMLADRGAHIYLGQRKENITADIDVVVYTSAIHPDNPEFIAMQELSIPSLTRAELVVLIISVPSAGRSAAKRRKEERISWMSLKKSR